MQDFLLFLRNNKIFWILPLVVFAIAIGFAFFVATRPVLESAIYRP